MAKGEGAARVIGALGQSGIFDTVLSYFFTKKSDNYSNPDFNFDYRNQVPVNDTTKYFLWGFLGLAFFGVFYMMFKKK